MPEIIGSAYVRIKAITDGLNSDIQRGLDKGAAGVNVDGPAKDLGVNFSKKFGDGVEEGGGDVRKKMQGIADGADDSGGFSWGKRWAAKMYLGMEDTQKSDGFLKSLDKVFDKVNDKVKVPRIALAGLFGSPAIGGAIQTLGSYVGALGAQLGYVATAAVGAAAGIGGAFGMAALAAGPLLLAFKTQTPALDLFKAKATVFKEIWQDVGESTQQTLLPALTDAMRETLKLVPVFQHFGGNIGKVAGDVAKMGAAMLTSSSNALPLNTILKSSENVFRILGHVAVTLGDGLIKLFAAVAPLAERFASTLLKMSRTFTLFIQDSSKSGTLTATLTEWYDRAELIGGAFVDLLKIIWNVFKIGGDAAQPFFDTLDAFTNRWLDFTNSITGQAKIKDAFDRMVPVAQAVNALLKDIVGWIVTPMANDSSGLVRFFDMLRQVVLPALEEIGSQLSGALSASLDSFVRSLMGFIQTAASGGTLTAFFGVLGMVLDVITTLVNIPGIQQFVGVMLALVGSLKAVSMVAGPFVGAISGMANALKTVLGSQALEPLQQAFQKFAMAPAAQGGLSGIAKAAGPLMAAIVNPVTLGFAAITAAVVGGIAIWSAWNKNQQRTADEIKQFSKTLVEGGDAIKTLEKSYQNILTTRKGFDDAFKQSGISIKTVTDLVNTNSADMDKMRAVWYDAGSNVRGLQRHFEELPKSVQPLAQQMIDLGTSLPGEEAKLSSHQVRQLMDSFGEMGQFGMQAAADMRAISMDIRNAGSEAGLTKEQLRQMDQVMASSGGIDGMTQGLQTLIETYPNLALAAGQPLSAIEAAASKVNQEFRDLIDSLKELSGTQADAEQAQRDYIISWDEMTKQFGEVDKAFQGTEAEIAKSENTLVRSAQAGLDYAKSLSEVDRTGAQTREALVALRDNIRNVGAEEGQATEKTDELLRQLGIYSDTDIENKVTLETAEAQTKIDEMTAKITALDQVPADVRVNLQAKFEADPLAAAAEYEKWFNIQQIREVTFPVGVDPKPAQEQLFKLLNWTKEKDGTINIQGNKVPYEEAVKAAKLLAEGTVAPIHIDGDPGKAESKVNDLVVDINETDGTINVLADTNPANTQTNTWIMDDLNKKKGHVQAGANTEPGKKDISNFTQFTMPGYVGWFGANANTAPAGTTLFNYSTKEVPKYKGNMTVGADTTQAGADINNFWTKFKPTGGFATWGRGVGGTSAAAGGGSDGDPNTPYSFTAGATPTMRATIEHGRSMATQLTNAGIAALQTPGVITLSPTTMASAAGSTAGDADPSNTVDVPGVSSGGGPALHITVKIGERDITEIVDVQMSGRMGQLATAIRRAS